MTDLNNFYSLIDRELADFKERQSKADEQYNSVLEEFLQYKSWDELMAAYAEIDDEMLEFFNEMYPQKEYTRDSFSEEDDERAIRLLQESLKSIEQMEYEKAIDQLSKALEYDITKPLYMILYEQLEISYRKNGNFDQAEECLKYLFSLDESFQTINDLIKIHELSGNNLKKFELRNKIRVLECDTQIKELMRIELLLKVKDYEGAIEEIKKLLKKAPNDVGLNQKLFDIYIEKDDYESAYKLAQRWKEVGIEEDLLYSMFILYSKMYDLDKASKYIIKYLNEKDPQTDKNYYSALGLGLVSSTYNHYFDDEEYVKRMWQQYNIHKPAVTNTFDIDTSYYRDMRIGFLSYDLVTHPVGYFILALFRGKHAYSGMNVYCYYTRPGISDNITKSIEKESEVFRYVANLNDEEMSRTILNDKLDILIDLNGCTVGTKTNIMMKRLAPVQITWMGFPCTSFTPNVDYLIGDYYTDPVGVTEQFLVEKPLRMSKNFICYPLAFDEEIKDPPCLANGYITFACLNGANKISGKILRLWAEVLKRVPGSKLLLRNSMINKPFLLEQLKTRLVENGIDLDRVIFETVLQFKDYLRSYNEVDILLDTYPFNGATTTCEAFYMGVPLVSLRGNRRPTRVAYSILANVGLEDLCSDSEEGFIETAVNLANDKERLKTIRKTLREATFQSPLCDTAAFKIEFENVLRRVYVDYCIQNKKEFTPEYESWDELVKSVILALHFIKSLIADKEAGERMEPLIKELTVLLNSLLVELEAAYQEDSAVLSFVQSLDRLIVLLPIFINNDEALIKVCDSLIESILRIV